jgi:hypothetical protein
MRFAEGQSAGRARTSSVPFWLIPLLSLLWIGWLLSLPPRPPAWIVALSGVPLLVLGSWLCRRGGLESWRSFVRRTADVHALAAILLVSLGVQFEDTHGITTDGVLYFSQLRSLIFDRDFDVTSELAFLGQPPRPSNVVPIGPTFLWLPGYLAVGAVDAIGRMAGLWPAPENPAALGLTLPYVRAALVASFAAGAAGLVVLHQHLREEFGSGVAFAATLLIFGATPLVWYMVYEPAMTHAASFGFVAFFVICAVRWTSPSTPPRRAIVLGALLGAAFVSRTQEVLFALVPAALLLTGPESIRDRLTAATRLAMWALLGALVFLVAQTVHTSILLSRESFVVTGEQGYLNVFRNRWPDTLWSSWHGFLSWSPVAYIATIGTAAYFARRRWWSVTALTILFLMALLNGSTTDWAAGWSFGGRRFVSCLVLLAPGLALTIEALTRRPMVAAGLVALGFVVWNQLLVTQYRSGMLHAGDAVSFGQIVRQQGALATRSPFFYPFAFPANAWFGWRNGLPIERYDLLGPEPLRPSLEIVFDASSNKYVMEGWGPRAGDEWGELRWIDGATADLLAPLDPPRNVPIELHIEWRARLMDPPSAAAVAVYVNGVKLGTASPAPTAPVVWSAGSHDAQVWHRGFNRIVLEKAGGTPPLGVYRLAIKPVG